MRRDRPLSASNFSLASYSATWPEPQDRVDGRKSARRTPIDLDYFAAPPRLPKDSHVTRIAERRPWGTTQAAVARLESGKTMPSTRTLERFAKATHTRPRIRFEPENPGNPAPQ
jgi:hypothetical protein